MSKDNASNRGIDRRSLLRQTGAVVGVAVGMSGLGTVSAQDEGNDEWEFEADVDDVPGLTAASIRVDKEGNRGTISHQYTYDVTSTDGLNLPLKSSLHLELPETASDTEGKERFEITQDGQNDQRPAGPEALDEASAIAEPRQADSLDESTENITTQSNHWDLRAWAETNSLVCGTLAESEVNMEQYFYSGLNYYFTDSDLSADGLESDCPIYVPIDTEWYLDSTDHDHGDFDISSEASFYNEDFPDLGSVDSDHMYDLEANGEFDIEVENSGNWSSFLIEVRSDTGLESI